MHRWLPARYGPGSVFDLLTSFITPVLRVQSRAFTLPHRVRNGPESTCQATGDRRRRTSFKRPTSFSPRNLHSIKPSLISPASKAQLKRTETVSASGVAYATLARTQASTSTAPILSATTAAFRWGTSCAVWSHREPYTRRTPFFAKGTKVHLKAGDATEIA